MVFFEGLKTNRKKNRLFGDGLWSYREKIWFFSETWFFGRAYGLIGRGLGFSRETWFFGRAFVLSEENLFLTELHVVLEEIWFFVGLVLLAGAYDWSEEKSVIWEGLLSYRVKILFFVEDWYFSRSSRPILEKNRLLGMACGLIGGRFGFSGRLGFLVGLLYYRRKICFWWNLS